MDPFQKKVSESRGSSSWWKPKPGDYIIGKFIRLEDQQYKGKATKVLLIRNEETGEETRMTHFACIERFFEDEGVKEGERVGIKFIENRKGYKFFIGHVDRKGNDK